MLRISGVSEGIRVTVSTPQALLETDGLSKSFPITKGVLRRQVGVVRAVGSVSIRVRHGETLAIVGESGCGKTTLAKTIVRLYRPTTGRIVFGGQDITGFTERELKPIRRRMQMVFQDPASSLNPRKQVKDLLSEPLRA